MIAMANSLFKEITEEQKEDVQNQLQDWFNQMFEPMSVIIDCPYALPVEYGTTPSTRKGEPEGKVSDPETGQMVTPAKLRFREWIGKKEGLHGKDRAEKGDAIYHTVMEEGSAPHPYIRPATEDMYHTVPEDAMGLTSEGQVNVAYAFFLAKRMIHYLESNKSVVTANLKSSIKVLPSFLADVAYDVKEVDVSESRYHWKPGQARK